MKKINFIKFILDIIMGIVFALLFNKNVLGGISFHETAGLAIGFAVLVHILLNWKWVMNVFKKLMKIKNKNKISGYIAKSLAVVVLAFGIYSMISVNFFSNTVQIFGVGRQMPFEGNRGDIPDFQFQQPTQNSNEIDKSKQQGGNTVNPQKNPKQNFQDGRGGKFGLTDGGKGMMEGKGRSASIPKLLATNLSIIGVFTALTYYIEKLLLRKRTV